MSAFNAGGRTKAPVLILLHVVKLMPEIEIGVMEPLRPEPQAGAYSWFSFEKEQ